MGSILSLETPEGKKNFYIMKIFDLNSTRYIALMPLYGDRVSIHFCRYESDSDNNRAKIYTVPTKDERTGVEEYFNALMSGKEGAV